MASEMSGKHGFGKEVFPSSLGGGSLYFTGGAGVGTTTMGNCFNNNGDGLTIILVPLLRDTFNPSMYVNRLCFVEWDTVIHRGGTLLATRRCPWTAAQSP